MEVLQAKAEPAAPLLPASLPVAPLPTPLRMAVIVASINRREEVGCLLRHLARQTVPPSNVVLSVESAGDVPETLDPHVSIIMGSRGLTKQRNRGLELVLDSADVIVFFDDDFVPAPDALEGISALFRDNPEIAGATGLVLADGVTCGGFSDGDAVARLQAWPEFRRPAFNVATDALYGCNMALRAAAVGAARFDENLPLYAWQEDVDFAGQLRAVGRIVKSSTFAGVHRGVQKSRSSGVPLGFSQIVNPTYLIKKGTMRPGKAVLLMLKNLVANHLKSVKPEAHIDRVGRMRGNWLGLAHVFAGKSDPTAILRLRQR